MHLVHHPICVALSILGALSILLLVLAAALCKRRFAALAARALRSEQQLQAVEQLAQEQARHAATLREDAERFRLIAEQAPVMLWTSDADGKSVYSNPPLREFHGSAVDSAPTEWTASLVTKDRRAVLAHFERALKERAGFLLHAGLRRADGELRFVHILARPRFSADGKFLGLIGVNTDVTKARQAERSLQRLNELLAQRVTATMAEKAEAETSQVHAQRLESLGRLMSGVAHDFKNLLTVVIGALDVIVSHPENAARRTRLAEAALAAARDGERLTAQLLDFARRRPLRSESCDLNALIRGREPLFRRATGEHVSLKVLLCQGEAIALVDPTQFEASLLNLVVNAVDASSAGGEIGIETAIIPAPEDETPGATAGRLIHVTVWDQGQGMSADVAGRIFEPFFTTKAPGKGTGLGLSRVHGFVKQSGGDVQVHSTPGAGTRVIVVLPLGRR